MGGVEYALDSRWWLPAVPNPNAMATWAETWTEIVKSKEFQDLLQSSKEKS
jgi:hypothetical protein